MSNEVVGIVEEIINNGKAKGSGLRINGLKYGVFDPTDQGLDEVAVGTTVHLRFKEADKGGGIVYKNVQGKVVTVKDGSAALTPMTAETAGGGTGVGGSTNRYRKNGEEGGFPIHAKAYERALDRRNALNVAASISKAGSTADAVIALAKQFEAYSTGDDVTTAEATLAFMNDEMD